jgi:hypothetical protein
VSKTIRVRVAVVLSANGEWSAYGSDQEDDEERMAEAQREMRNSDESVKKSFWLVAELPVPVAAEIVASVEEVK